MAACTICAEELPPEAKSCPVCGTSIGPGSAAETSPTPVSAPVSEASPEIATESITMPSVAGSRRCPVCQSVFDASYTDSFCTCGAELPKTGITGTDVGSTPTTPVSVPPLPRDTRPSPPTAGTVCLTVFSADREPLYYHVLDADITVIGRSDPVRGDFPDLDLSDLFDESTAKRVSRKHALVLRSRETGRFTLRPLAKNTGTQVERDLATELTDYPLTDGTRLVLGGIIRIKFEVTK